MDRIEITGRLRNEGFRKPSFDAIRLEGETKYLLKIQDGLERDAAIFVRRLQKPNILDYLALATSPGSNQEASFNSQKRVEELFESNFESAIRKVKPEWSEQQQATYARWAGATAVKALKQQVPFTVDHTVVDSIALTAKRIILKSAQRSRRMGFTVDPEWLRELALEVLRRAHFEMANLRSDLEVFVNNPPLEQLETV